MDLCAGIDIGTQNSCVAVIFRGSIDVVENHRGSKQTPTCVGFVNGLRVYGEDALDQNEANIGGIIDNFKQFIGENVGEKLRDLYESCPYNLSMNSKNVEIKVRHNKEDFCFIPEQLLAMHLSNLRRLVKNHNDQDLTAVTLSVPVFYSAKQRRALIDACEIANIKCQALVNETTAIATWYCTFNPHVPNFGERERIAAFVSVGHMHTQVMICAFTKQTIRVLSTRADVSLGGWHLDQIIYGKMKEKYCAEFGIQVDPKSYTAVRLRNKCAELKTRLCLSSREAQVRVDGLPQEHMWTMSLSDSELETWSVSLSDRLRDLCNQCLLSSGVKKEKLDAVELVGGCFYLPFMKRLILDVLSHGGSGCVMEKEVVAIGCALHAAKLSKTNQVETFEVSGEEVVNPSFYLSDEKIRKFKRIERNLCSIDKSTKEMMSLVNEAQRLAYELMDKVDIALTKSERKEINAVLEKILKKLNFENEFNKQLCFELVDYARDANKNVPLFAETRYILEQDVKKLDRFVSDWWACETNYLDGISRSISCPREFYSSLQSIEESQNMAEASRESVRSLLNEIEDRLNRLKRITRSFKETEFARILVLPNITETVQNLKKAISISESNHWEVESRIQELKQEVERICEEKSRWEWVPKEILNCPPFGDVSEIRNQMYFDGIWNPLRCVWWMFVYLLTSWNPHKRIPLSPPQNDTVQLEYFFEIQSHLQWNAFNKNRIRNRISRSVDNRDEKAIWQWSLAEDELSCKLKNLAKALAALGSAFRSPHIHYSELITKIQNCLDRENHAADWNDRCLTQLYLITPVSGAARDRWLMQKWIEYHKEISVHLVQEKRYLESEMLKIKTSLTMSRTISGEVQQRLNGLCKNTLYPLLGILSDCLSKLLGTFK
ncbi:hypothetical protein D915_005690 [Fasciola hepatica]|uniref:DnaK family protein n=1 Tax=Fasciola hepatica TaxID=6192 RepID=A0A4E0R9S5_FASHE|nr:hypothetical protein D915_005690 [Fasciola hepatica]